MQTPHETEALACSLNSAAFRERRTLVRRRLLPHVTGIARSDSGVILAFANTDALYAELEAFMDLERQCCGFLTFTLSPAAESLTLSIEGPEEAAAILDMFAAVFEEPAP